MREKEDDKLIPYRGPPASARDDVLKKFPFQARLAPVDPDPAKSKGGFWPFR